MTEPVGTTRNLQVAERLRQFADLLASQRANPFRVGAYRRAADTVAGLGRDVGDIHAEQGVAGLEALPGIGSSIAATIAELVRTGRSSQLERLRGSLDPEALFQTVPGIGPALARRIHDGLHVDTLEAFEATAHDGSLEALPGVGPRRAAMVRAALAGMLARTRPPRSASPGGQEPGVALLLDVDREYREGAEAGRLPTIAPRRFNPTGEAWLPVLHTERGSWHFSALFSNTARAHELGHTRDWVVIYFTTDGAQEGQRTVVTETAGVLAGRRVVRGLEAACREYYRSR
ncbi:MAG: helix-hairpin-helix domain-containing protein [Steroidobacteraceae bacterium]|jgi:putative hydrolase|nr:helix-hairpin-helix domain-containing protein [Steroidobacteraceae bacterium]